MSRLTSRDEFGNADIIGVDSSDLYCMMDFKETNAITNALNKLADYEDKEEQGLLLVLKAKVGDDIFKIINGVISRLRITRIEVTNYGIEYFVWGYTLTNEGYGVTWFSTESEAESALAKMGGSHEDTD